MVGENEKRFLCQDYVMKDLPHTPRKSLGQNFLHDRNVIDRIVQSIHPQKNEHFVEIGPGYGALTTSLLPLVEKLDAIELDSNLIPELEKNCENLGNLHIHNFDALKLDLQQIYQNKALRVAGNLPYQISTPLIFHLLKQVKYIADMHFMLQKEVVDRMTAKPGSKIYGRLSVMVQYHCTAKFLFSVPATAFTPKPQVESAIIRLIPHQHLPYIANDYEKFSLLVRESFNHRRKTIRKSLNTFVSSEQLISINIDPQIRPEQLGVEEFVRITNITMEDK